MPNITEFRDIKAVAAYAGLSPRHYQSGSIEYRSRLAKTGKRSIAARALLPAITAMRHNRPIREFAKRLRARGKTKMTIVAAAMRKLLTLPYGVLNVSVPKHVVVVYLQRSNLDES